MARVLITGDFEEARKKLILITGDFEEARKKLKTIGVVLTTHPHKKGGFVCYASRELRLSMEKVFQTIESL